jgi:hypothetical protein
MVNTDSQYRTDLGNQPVQAGCEVLLSPGQVFGTLHHDYLPVMPTVLSPPQTQSMHL